MPYEELEPELDAPEAVAGSHTQRTVLIVLAVATAIALVFINQHFQTSALQNERTDYSSADAAHSFVGDTDTTPTTAATWAPAVTTVVTAPPPTTASTKFYAADSGFRAAFPGTPERTTQTISVGPVSLEMTMYVLDLPDRAYAVAKYALPAGGQFDLDHAANGGVAGMGGQIVSKNATTFRGYPAVEVVGSVDEGFVRAIVFRKTGGPAYMILVGTNDNSAKLYEQFRDSVELVA